MLQYLKDLDEIRIQLASTQESADARAVLAQTSQLQCLVLLKELDEKNSSLSEHEIRVNKLGEQLNLLQKDLKARESSQTELKYEVLRMEQDIMQAVAKAGSSGDRELRRILDEVAAPRNFDKINKLLSAKDEEILNLKREIHILNTHWELKSKELESQVWSFPYILRSIVCHYPYVTLLCIMHGFYLCFTIICLTVRETPES